MPLIEYEAFVEEWKAEEHRNAYRNAELCATIMNKPVFGYTRERIITAAELMGESSSAPASSVGSPEALKEFIKLGAEVQRREREARGV